MYKSCVICIHKKICILQIVHWSEISTNCSGITYSWTSCWVQIMFSKISGGRWPLSVRLLVFVKITQSWLLYISRKLGNQIHVQNYLKLFLDICRYLAAQGVQNLVLKKCMISFFFFFAVHIFPHAFLECHSSPCYKSEICLHIFWDFFFFLINCVLFEGRNLHIFLLGASWFCSAHHCSAQALVEAFQEAALRALLSLLLGCEHWVGVP